MDSAKDLNGRLDRRQVLQAAAGGALAAAGLYGCGGGGSNGGGGGGGGGSSISDTQRAAVIQSVKGQFAQIVAAGGDVDSQNSAIAAVMAGMPEFEESGSDDEFDSAWGRFKDGRLLIIGNIPFPEGSRSPSRASRASY